MSKGGHKRQRTGKGAVINVFPSESCVRVDGTVQGNVKGSFVPSYQEF